jgi:hypothetical protein
VRAWMLVPVPGMGRVLVQEMVQGFGQEPVRDSIQVLEQDWALEQVPGPKVQGSGLGQVMARELGRELHEGGVQLEEKELELEPEMGQRLEKEPVLGMVRDLGRELRVPPLEQEQDWALEQGPGQKVQGSGLEQVMARELGQELHQTGVQLQEKELELEMG